MNYDECIALISSAEAYDTEARSIVVDVYDLGKGIGIRQYSERDAERLIDQISGVSVTVQQKPAAEQQAKPRQKEKAAREAQEQVRTTEKPVAHVEAASKELESQLKSAESFDNYVESSNDDRLVLPGLPIRDQINELEKISLGIDRKAFDSEQMDIIREEVSGLVRRKKAPADDAQKKLAQIRDDRLKEVASKLGV